MRTGRLQVPLDEERPGRPPGAAERRAASVGRPVPDGSSTQPVQELARVVEAGRLP